MLDSIDDVSFKSLVRFVQMVLRCYVDSKKALLWGLSTIRGLLIGSDR